MSRNKLTPSQKIASLRRRKLLMGKYTCLQIKKTTRDKLHSLKDKFETWDDLINRLIVNLEKYEHQKQCN